MPSIRIWKDVLIPGTYRLSDGRRVTYTECDCRVAALRGREMIRAGLNVPVCWGHDPVAEPEYHPTAWRAISIFGEVEDYRLGPFGECEALLSIDDRESARRLARVGMVSPKVDLDWTDARGKVWRGLVILHVAATAQPVQFNQRRVPAKLGR